jgi:hypothetical protein
MSVETVATSSGVMEAFAVEVGSNGGVCSTSVGAEVIWPFMLQADTAKETGKMLVILRNLEIRINTFLHCFRQGILPATTHAVYTLLNNPL